MAATEMQSRGEAVSRFLGWAAALVTSLLVSSAEAQRRDKHPDRPQVAGPSAADNEARLHLQRGAEAAAASNWHVALGEYYAANLASRSIVGLEGIANAHYHLGHDTSAIEAYSELVKASPPIAPGDRVGQQMWASTKARAEARLAELTARTSAAASSSAAAAPAPSRPLPPAPPLPPLPSAGQQGADPRLWTEHGHRTYTAVRTSVPPKIDGVLDDGVWKVAPIDSRFLNALSKPYGQQAPDPTSVQVAYDDDYLYVAARCLYRGPDERDNSYPSAEAILFSGEFFAVSVDARHDHTNQRAFAVSRMGVRADVDQSRNGDVANLDWRGVWDVDTKADADSWTAEYAIPWSTLGLPSHDGDFAIGINFRRDIPPVGVRATWSLVTPAPGFATPPSFSGHLLGLSNIHPGKRLFLQPFVLGKYRSDKPTTSRLRDFAGKQGNLLGYAGLYARFRPVGPLQVDLAINPDFSSVPPDQALTNLDRFELAYPETRPFFAEDRARFEMGGDNAQLFYSRRVGLIAYGSQSNPKYAEVPILYSAKSILRESGTEAAVMNVGISTPDPRISVSDNVTVARVNHFFGGGTRIGSIILLRRGDRPAYTQPLAGPTGPVGYLATGVDGSVAFMNENLVVSGFVAESATERAPSGLVAQGDIHWDSADFEARLTYLDVSNGFDPQLGYFQATGAKTVTALGGYTPIVNNDFVHEIDLRALVARARTQQDQLLYDRVNLSFQAFLINGTVISVAFQPSIEGVRKPFTIADGQVTIPAARYDVNNLVFSISSPPRRRYEAALSYTEGELFYGYQRSPQVQLGTNVGKFSTSTLYRLLFLDMASKHLTGHQVSSRTAFSYTALARSILQIQANTLDSRATVQLINTWNFGELSSAALILVQTAPSVGLFFNKPDRSAILSLSYGLSVL